MGLFKDIYLQLATTRWNIGFIKGDPSISWSNDDIHWLRHNKKSSWFADPFILSENDEVIEVLVEEWVDALKRGRVSKLTIVRSDFSLADIKPIIELDSHLSFPAILRRDGEVYIYPENYVSGGLTIYRYDTSADKIERVGAISDVPLTDAVIDCDHFDKRNLIFSTDASSPSGKVLSVYESPDIFGRYEKIGEISFPDKCARNAGSFFALKNDIIRPAQDCNKRYGAGLVFQRVKYIDGKFEFEEILRKFPSNCKWNLGIHTFNSLNDISVVDGYAYRTPLVGNFLNNSGIICAMLSARRKFFGSSLDKR